MSLFFLKNKSGYLRNFPKYFEVMEKCVSFYQNQIDFGKDQSIIANFYGFSWGKQNNFQEMV